MPDLLTRDTMPPGDYAIVELFGHTKLVGRVDEVEKYGAKMLAVEPLFGGQFPTPVLHGAAAIYGIVPCTPEIAFDIHPQSIFSLPRAIRVTLPAQALPAPEAEADDASEVMADAHV